MDLYESTFNQKEAAAALHINPITLWRWVKAGLVPTIQVGGRKRFRKIDIARIIENGTIQA